MFPVLRSTAMCNLRHASLLWRFAGGSNMNPQARAIAHQVDRIRIHRGFPRSRAASMRTQPRAPTQRRVLTGFRYRAREARRSSARSLRFVHRRACTPSGQPSPFRSPCLNRPVDRQAYRSSRPSSSRSASSSNQTVNSPRQRSPSVVFRPVANVVQLLLRVLVLAALGILHARDIPRPPP